MSSESRPNNYSTESAPMTKSTGLDLATPHTETPNKEKNSNEENIDSNFLIEAVHHIKEGKTIVTDPKQQDQLRNKGFGEVFNKEYLLNNLECLFLLQNNKIKIYTKK